MDYKWLMVIQINNIRVLPNVKGVINKAKILWKETNLKNNVSKICIKYRILMVKNEVSY